MLLNIDNSLWTDSRSCYKRRTWYTEGHKRLLIDRHVPLVVKMQMMFPIFPKAGGKIESTDYTARSHWSWFNICSFQLHRLPAFQTCNLETFFWVHDEKTNTRRKFPKIAQWRNPSSPSLPRSLRTVTHTLQVIPHETLTVSLKTIRRCVWWHGEKESTRSDYCDGILYCFLKTN